MTSAIRSRARGLVAWGGLASLLIGAAAVGRAEGAPEKPGEPAAEAPDEELALGRELFTREWLTNDTRSHGGDGLGPVYNERSCRACHHQGGRDGGGGGFADRNIEIATATRDGLPASGFFYSFSMNFGGQGFQYRFGTPEASRSGSKPLNIAELVKIHPGFRDGTSVVLHRYGPDFDYRDWRDAVPGPHGAIQVQTSQRNPTPLFGIGLIDAIPDEVLEAAAKRRFPGPNPVKGRVSRLADGRIGRFGWKAQTATLREFVLAAASGEMGLEVPGRHQGADPRIPPLAPPGLDMDKKEVDALAAYVRSLPAPVALRPDGPKDERTVRAGASLFRSIGCAHCHLPKLGDVEGIYSDLLLHDMSPRLSDTGAYGVFATHGEDEAPRGLRPKPVAGRKREAGATLQEWRTPPLWGLRDSAPYLHDGRAGTVTEAVEFHGGQGAAAARRFAQLSDRERQSVEAFLLSLAAPRPGR